MTQIVRDEERIEELCADLSALSNDNRLRLLHILTRPRYREEIAEALSMSRQSASKHIEKLEQRGFVRELQGWRDTGPVAEYQVVPQRLFALGMRIADLGRLEPEGGPEREREEQTMMLSVDHQPDACGEEAGACPTAHLLVVSGPEAGKRFELDGEGPRWTIGRDADRDLELDHDPFVSSRHAEVQVDPEGHALVDVFSSNGTRINFARIPEGGRAVLQPGDVISVGRTSLVYQAAPRQGWSERVSEGPPRQG